MLNNNNFILEPILSICTSNTGIANKTVSVRCNQNANYIPCYCANCDVALSVNILLVWLRNRVCNEAIKLFLGKAKS